MANSSYLATRLSALPVEQRVAVIAAFDYICANLKAGRANPGETQPVRQSNFQWYPLSATTPSTPDEEFIVPHGLPFTPYNLIPCLPLTTTGMSLIPLTVTRPADSRNVYLSSSVGDADVTFFVEG
jgi:hypothetical protein